MPFGREPDASGRLGLVIDAAAREAPGAATLDALRLLFGLGDTTVLDYRDGRAGCRRSLRVSRDGEGAERLQAFWLSGTAAADAALATTWREALLTDAPLPVAARRMLSPAPLDAAAPAPARGPQLCACFDVSVASASAALDAATGDVPMRLAHVQARLRCGTNCGSCLPQLRRLAQQSVEAATATGSV
jgi:assimilatory nitrate reductase catalytic subunit